MAESKAWLDELDLSAVKDGSSIVTANQKLKRTNYRVVVTIEVINATKWQMRNPQIQRHGGAVELQATEVAPGCKERLVVRKRFAQATGSHGTVSWDVGGKQVIIMWSAPFNFDFYANTLAVGITDDEQQRNRRESFNEMYYGHGKSYFVREHFKDHTRDITKSDGTLSVRGSMGTSHEPIITIVVSSFHKGDLAKNCRL